MMHDDNWWWNMPMMWIWITVIIICIVVLVKLLDKTSNRVVQKESPLDILKRRYANGEITTEEYEKRKKILEGN